MAAQESLDQLRIRQEGTFVQFIVGGVLVAEMPWNVALQVADITRHVARKAEEIAKREQVAFEHAMLLKVGAPFGLATNPDVIKLGEHMAQYDRDLNRYMGFGIKSTESVGVPTVIQHKPKGTTNG